MVGMRSLGVEGDAKSAHRAEIDADSVGLHRPSGASKGVILALSELKA